MRQRLRIRRLRFEILDYYQSAKAAGLRYVTDTITGIQRRRCGKGWRFLLPGGGTLRDRTEIERIQSLAIPPAWTEVWICPDARGHLQAVGWDARGRKQYRYHPLYREVRDSNKFTRMLAFGLALPGMRAQVEQDLKLPDLPRRKVLAAIVRLLEHTSVRVGNEEYARSNESFGLTTLRDHHVEVEGHSIRFFFKGKSGVEHDLYLQDRRLARIVAACQDLEGQELFQYVSESGEQVKICSEDVNHYIRELTGEDFTAKDLRTWNGTREALRLLSLTGPAASVTEAKRNVVAAIKGVAAELRNRPATCRKYYIHPAIPEAYQNNTLWDVMDASTADTGPYGLSKEEAAMVRIISEFPASKPVSRRRS